MRDFAELWQTADEIVYSTTLDRVSIARRRIERSFDPVAAGRMKATTGLDMTVGGPWLPARSGPAW